MSDYEGFKALHAMNMETRQKLVFFLMAAASACVGFAVQQTDEAGWRWPLLLCAAAVLSFGVSFYSGYRVIRSNIHLFHLNGYLLMDSDKARNEKRVEMMEVEGDAESRWTAWQIHALILGALLFIAWHAVRLYENYYGFL
ncbi:MULTISPECIES: hypothetical protein [unclassified Pseudoxanthomonas]|uniref:hypothetical protein n=1 Tax=unclassified Pseudoxanthomonas TaxID=2645906 RepID=UPI0030776C6E